MNRLVPILAIAALAAGAHRAAADCTIATPASVVTYWSQTSGPSIDRCDGAACHFSGWLFKPTSTAANLPAIVYVTGNDRTQSRHDACEIVNYFVSRGYVVFMPYARGVTDDSVTSPSSPGNGFHNTGTFITDWANDNDSSSLTFDQAAVAYLGQETHDMWVALTWLRAQKNAANKPLIGPVALMGYNLGGVMALELAGSTESPLPDAVVDLSGGSLQWNDDPQWETTIEASTAQLHTPTLLQDVANDAPDDSFSSTLGAVQYAYTQRTPPTVDAKTALYAGFTVSHDAQAVCTAHSYGAPRCASYTFVTDGAQTARWLSTVHDFVVEYGVH